MGAWGTGPYDNDAAADWLHHLEKMGLYKKIEEGLNSNDYDEVRAATWLVQRLGVSAYVYDVDCLDMHIELAEKRLNEILNDKEWLGMWNDMNETVTSLKKQLSEIKNLGR